MFASLLYASSAAPGMDSGDVFEIIEISSRNNPGRDVTGFLLFDGREFLQYVEGPQAALDALLDTLAKDRRHHSLRVLNRTTVAKRLFPKWSMRRAGPGAETGLATIRASDLPPAMITEIDRFGAQRRAA